MNDTVLAIRPPSPAQQQLKQALRKTLEQDRTLLMFKQPFTSLLAMRLRLVVVVDDRMPTACTDGESMFFNAEFLAGRTDADRRFILAHEVWHCALAHGARCLGRNQTTWNIACDYEVNHILHAESGHHPADALFDKKLHGQSAEEIYGHLCQQPQPKHGRETLDIHDAQQALNSKGVVLDPDFNPRQPLSQQQQLQEAEGWRQQLANAAQQTRGIGNLPAHLKLTLSKMFNPPANWQQLLRRFIQRTLTGGERQWLPPSRRHIHRGLYLPACKGGRLELAVAIDTSGSCADEISRFMQELEAILASFNQVRLRVVTFDIDINERYELTEHDLSQLSKLDITGGGGTDFSPVFEEFEENPPQALIMFTDGYAWAPANPGYPVLWALTPDGRPPVDWGEVLQLNAV